MSGASVDLNALVRRLANREKGRTEATVQSDIHALLLAAPFQLDDHQVEEIVLESPAGDRRRIDIEVGLTVVEVKRDLRTGNVFEDAVEQLAGYVASRVEAMDQRYVGVLTDGCDWRLYHLVDDELLEVSRHQVNPTKPDLDALVVWLEGVMATASQLTPTPREIVRRLGADTPAHALDATELAALYDEHRDVPTVKQKRELWARLLTTALGTNFEDTDELFVNHTLLVASAEIVAHAVTGFDPADPTVTPAALLSGELFAGAQIGGVVEADFFDWVIEVPDGDRWVRSLAKRLARFDWSAVEHDVMKVLYESVITAEQRHRLGEYYTPDWLADRIVDNALTDPLNQRVLDPGCGSGTFLFHAVRQHLAAAEAAGMDLPETLRSVQGHVFGLDVHPVAVAFARVTYLLAIGRDRMRAPDRPPMTVPVYLGDSLQWGQEQNLFAAGGNLNVATADGGQLFADLLQFPERVLADAGQFDRLVSELADKAANRAAGSAVPSLEATFRRFAVHDDDRNMVAATFKIMCELHDQGRDHIWGYYVRNLARPAWFARPGNRVDVLVGNPPWLAYRYMTAEQQEGFRVMSEGRGLWAGAAVATNQDLSGLFVARCAELYLETGGRFGFVMPRAVLDRRQFVGFRTGNFSGDSAQQHVAFTGCWDLHKVKPSFFPVPGAVVFGESSTTHVKLPTGDRKMWSGRLPEPNMAWVDAEEHLSIGDFDAGDTNGPGSPYAPRFAQGATIVPRALFMVEDVTDQQPLGVGAGRKAVRSARSKLEKKPWKELPDRQDTVESQFVRPVLLGSDLLPHKVQEPGLGVIPWDGKKLLAGDDAAIDQHPGLANRWRELEQLWTSNRSSDRLDLLGRLDYQRGLSQQFPVAPNRVLYGKAGMYLCAARTTDTRALVDHKLYWAATASEAEAIYLVTILNSPVITEAVRPLQGRGEHNPRDVDKYVWQLPIPLYDPADETHRWLAELGAKAETIVAKLELPAKRFETQRRFVRESLAETSVGTEIDERVAELLAG